MDDSTIQIRTPRLDIKIELARKRAEAERKAARAVPMTGEVTFEKNDHQPDAVRSNGSLVASLMNERDKYKAFAEAFARRLFEAGLIVDIEPRRDEVTYLSSSRLGEKPT